MDAVTGLAALSQAIGIAKDLRDIDRSVDEAAFKLKLADLTESLADAKISLSDANLQINEQKQKLSELEKELATAKDGEVCPKCREGRLKLIEAEPHRQQGLYHYGVQKWTSRCDNSGCCFEQESYHDPHGVLPKAAAGKFR